MPKKEKPPAKSESAQAKTSPAMERYRRVIDLFYQEEARQTVDNHRIKTGDKEIIISLAQTDLRLGAEHFLPHQWQFLTASQRCKALAAGFGSGKTFAFLFQTLIHYLGNGRVDGRSNGWIIYPTLDLADELFIPPFCSLLDKAGVEYHYRRTNRQLSSEYGELRLYSLQTPQRLVGAELTFAGFDEFDVENEERCLSAYKKALGRLRGCDNPVLYIVTTPEGFKATHRLFVDEAQSERTLIRARTTDNPHLPVGYVESLKNQYDPRLLSQYLEGEFVNLCGSPAYYAFNRDTHVIEPRPDLPGSGTELWVGMDFNVDPMTAVCAIMEHGQWVVFTEIWLEHSNTESMARHLKQLFPNRELIICPDMTGIRQTTAGSAGFSDINILKSHGFRICGSSNPFVRDRLNTVNASFSNQKLVITSNCKRLIRDLEQVVLDDQGELNKSSRFLTHISDALGYFCWRCLFSKGNGWRW